MNKFTTILKFVALIGCVACTYAYGAVLANPGAVAAKAPAPAYVSAGVLTPDIATGFLYTDRFEYDRDGDVVVCLTKYDLKRDRKTCTDEQNRNKWVLMKNAIPPGRKFVGFTVVGVWDIVIYWK